MSIERIYKAFQASSGICTDTRKITPDCLFFALKGDNFNGNKYALEALKAGAKFAVVDEKIDDSNERVLLVDDALTCLQELAHHHRSKFSIPIIGITGSNGKTTTKELIREVLGEKYRVHATSGNFNNHIGVPLTLLSMPEDTEMAIVEMGANHVGEIAALCNIAAPTHGIITNIGKAHLEGFGGIEGVIRGKSELYHYLIQHDGVAFINSQNDILYNMSKRFDNPILYPSAGDFYHCTLLSAKPFVHLRSKTGLLIASQLIGEYNFENIASALCIGSYFDVPEASMKEAVEAYLPDNNRSQLIKTDSNLIILDAYNANPNSMSVAIDNLSNLTAEKKVAIIGDMLELGEDSVQEHYQIGQQLADLQLNNVFLCGPHSKSAKNACPEAIYFESKEELVDYLKLNRIDNSSILIKASRGMGLESLVTHL
jgi:UDP-N-acetylmuramoyl-tripeptide--D-alanyl-D-alanine ligase